VDELEDDEIERFIPDIKKRGFDILNDWTNPILDEENNFIICADRVLVFMNNPHHHYRELWHEILVARLHCIPIIMVGDFPQFCVPGPKWNIGVGDVVHVKTYEEAMEILEKVYK